MKKVIVVPAALALTATVLIAIFVFNYFSLSSPETKDRVRLPFLVGVTYCGNITEEA